MAFSLQGHVALVTGNSTGLGKAIGLTLGRAGAKVPVNYFHNEERARQTLADYQAAGVDSFLCRSDVTTEAGVDELFRQTEAKFGAWRESHSGLDLVLVRGNHDAHAGDPCADWRIDCIDEGAAFGPFIANHHPEPARGGYVLAGHIHPAVRLSDEGGSFKLPCFWFSRKVGVLPAFGAFTGTAVVRPREGDQVYVIADDEVLRVG